MAEYLRSERHRSGNRPRVRVEQQLRRVATQALGQLPGPADPVAVRLAGPHPGDEGVPDVMVAVPQRDLRLCARVVEQAQPDAVGDAGGNREVRPGRAAELAGCRPERERAPW